MSSFIGRAPFVARERELMQLTARLEVAGERRGGLVLVSGDPGIGKTRILASLAADARAAGWLVLSGVCYESELAAPYLPFTEALTPYVRDCPLQLLRAQLGEGAAEVARLVREIRSRLLDLPSTPTPQGEYDRYHLFKDVSDFLLSVAGSGDHGLLLLLDDLHWADKPTLLLLQHLVRRLADAPLLIVGAHRTVDLGRSHPLTDLLAELSRERLAEHLTLPAFSEDEAARLIEGLAGAPAAPAVVEAVWRLTSGKPFFVEELARHLLAEGHDLGDARTAARDWGMPEGVRRVVAKRLSRLSPEAVSVLQAGAVLDDGFTFALLKAATEAEEGPLIDALEEVLEAGVLVEHGDLYSFGHGLIRETVYRDLSSPRRMRLHRRAAEAIERMAAPPTSHLGALAHHFSRAGPEADRRKVATYARRAGDHALTMLGYEEAARLYQLALEHMDEEDPRADEQRCGVLLSLGGALHRAGDVHAAMATFQLAAATARPLRRPELLARAALGFEDALLPAGTPRAGSGDPSVLLLQEALAALPLDGSSLRARVMAALARALHFGGVHDRARALSDEALALTRHAGDPTSLAYTLNVHRMLTSAPDDLDDQVALATELLQLAHAVGDRELALEGHQWRLTTLVAKGDMAAVDREIGECERVASAIRQPYSLASVAAWRTTRAIQEGRFSDAERLAHEMIEVGRPVQNQNVGLLFASGIAAIRRAVGSPDELRDALRAMEEAAGKVGAPYELLGPLYAAWYCDLGEMENARREFERMAANRFAGLPRGWLWLVHACLLAEVCVALGDRARAATLYDLLMPYAGHNAAAGEFEGAVARYLGLLATTLNHVAEAKAHFEAAIAFNTLMGARPWIAYTQFDYACLLLAGAAPDDERQAVALLQDALHTARALKMPRLEEQILARSTPARPPRDSQFNGDGLSERELEVLRLLAGGRTNREIAAELVVSARTVEHHVERIYAKIGARRRAEATAYALQHGLVVLPHSPAQ